MRWYIFAIFAFLALALELGMRPLTGVATPSFTLLLGMFIAISASPSAIPVAAVVLGLLVDLTRLVPGMHAGDELILIGPAALGYLAGMLLVARLRNMAFRDSPLALAAMVLVGGAVARLVTILLLTARGFSWLTAEPIPGWRPRGEVYDAAVCLLMTAAAALPVGYALIKSRPMWGFYGR